MVPDVSNVSGPIPSCLIGMLLCGLLFTQARQDTLQEILFKVNNKIEC